MQKTAFQVTPGIQTWVVKMTDKSDAAKPALSINIIYFIILYFNA